jgi:hypothetical protein
MPTVLRTYESTYKSYSYSKDPSFFGTVGIKATHLKNGDGKEYLKFRYKYTGLSEGDGMTIAHPFHGLDEKLVHYKDGCIVRYSRMVKKMLDFLLMDDLELQRHIGRTYSDDYRRGIILSLIHLKVRREGDIVNNAKWISCSGDEMNERKLALHFYGDQAENPDSYSDVTAVVSHLTYDDGDQYISILYGYDYNGSKTCFINKSIPKTNPFYGQGTGIQEHLDGDIVKYNPMIKEMVNTLLINELEFKKQEGYDYPKCYRNGIILALVHFWD